MSPSLPKEDLTMNRDLLRHPLCLLLSGLMLTACGGNPDEGLTPAEEWLGTQESAICAGASVSNLTISGFSSYGGLAAGSGTWAVTYPANAVHLDFYIDGVVRGVTELLGDSNRTGTWNFSYEPVSCGSSHTFEVRAYPMSISSSGEKSWCPGSGTQVRTQTFTEACPTAALSCSRSSSTAITCTGGGSGGNGGPYNGYWYETEKHNSGLESSYGWYQAPLTTTFYCRMSSIFFPSNGTLTISFSARDVSGLFSPVVARTYPCVF
jgi:hypothetical protein